MATSRNFKTVSEIRDNPIPRKLRTRGLQDYHPRPLAAHPKNEDGLIFPRRMDAVEAWKMPYVELQPANSWAVLVLDCDDPDWILGSISGLAPKPSYFVWNRENDHMQIAWILKDPVHRNQQSARKPLIKLGCVTGKLTKLFRADPDFQSTLARNPAYEDEFRETIWCPPRIKGYALDQLDIPGDARPEKTLLSSTAVGRNVSVFEDLMQFAGSWRNREANLLAKALELNSAFETPLGGVEIGHVVKSVGRYRQQWIREGRYYGQDSQTQRDNQAKMIASRWKKSADRDVEILTMRLEGKSMQGIADEMKLTRLGVTKLLSNEKRVRSIAERLPRRHRWKGKKYLDDQFGGPFKTTVQD